MNRRLSLSAEFRSILEVFANTATLLNANTNTYLIALKYFERKS